MALIWMAFRTELRDRWRAWLGLAFGIALVAGFVIAAAAGARRTDSAYERFLREQRAFDVVVFPSEECQRLGLPLDECDARRAAEISLVRDSTTFFGLPAYDVTNEEGVSLDLGRRGEFSGVGEVGVIGRAGESFQGDINRARVLEGRLPDPSDPEEVLISSVLAKRRGVQIGDRLRTARLNTNDGGVGPRMSLRVVGIGVAPFEIEPPSGLYTAVVHVTPAAVQKAIDANAAVTPVLAVRLRGGDANVEAFTRDIQRRGIRASVMYRQADQAKALRRAIDPEVAALTAIAAITGLAALALFGSVLGRQAWAASSTYPTLWSLGARRRQLVALTLLRAGAIGAVATLGAVLVAIVLSPLAPVGLTREVEIDPGIALDGMALAIGAMATLLSMVALVAWPAWRSAAVATTAPDVRVNERPAGIFGTARQLPLSPPARVGVRMALDSGRGARAVPVRTAFLGVSAGVIAVVATLGFSSGLNHLVTTHRLVGFSWDAVVYPSDENFDAPRIARHLREVPTVRGATIGSIFVFGGPFDGEPLELGAERTPVELIVMDPGPVRPVVLRGRAPRGAHEIAVGSETLDELGLEIGDQVRARGFERATMRVVGTAAVPAASNDPRVAGRTGRGAILTLRGLRMLDPAATPSALFVAFEGGADRAAAFKTLRRAVDGRGAGVFGDESSAELHKVVDIARIEDVPPILAGLLALLATTILLHLLVTSVRARRHDLAVLRALGFRRRELRLVVIWQAATVSLVALSAGLVLGGILGSNIWDWYAESIGVFPEGAVPVVGMVIVALGGLLITRMVASWPGHTAARIRTSEVLRAE